MSGTEIARLDLTAADLRAAAGKDSGCQGVAPDAGPGAGAGAGGPEAGDRDMRDGPAVVRCPFVAETVPRIMFCPASPQAILILDGAGWHGAKALVLPDNLSLLTLPPPDRVRGRLSSPELNPVANVC